MVLMSIKKLIIVISVFLISLSFTQSVHAWNEIESPLDYDVNLDGIVDQRDLRILVTDYFSDAGSSINLNIFVQLLGSTLENTNAVLSELGVKSISNAQFGEPKYFS